MSQKICILTKDVAERKMSRMALEIAEQLSGDPTPLVLIGIRENGMVIAEMIGRLLKQYLECEIRLVACRINKVTASDVAYEGGMDFNNVNVIVVDDVINSGRTLLYALKPLLETFPKRIQILSLVERMHTSFPIKTDFVGLSVATTLLDHIQVEVRDGAVQGAYLM